MKVKIKRVYAEPANDDGLRILVDRLWPRGLAKQKANIDVWAKEIAPSTELRKWFDHDPGKWKEFKRKYQQELRKNKEQVSNLKNLLKNGPDTLVYAARDEQHNGAIVLSELFNR